MVAKPRFGGGVCTARLVLTHLRAVSHPTSSTWSPCSAPRNSTAKGNAGNDLPWNIWSFVFELGVCIHAKVSSTTAHRRDSDGTHWHAAAGRQSHAVAGCRLVVDSRGSDLEPDDALGRQLPPQRRPSLARFDAPTSFPRRPSSHAKSHCSRIES
eukprot:1788620-Rhodomonas_salina.2